MPVVKKMRDSNLELFRIVLMLAIIAHHYVVNSGLTDVLLQNPTAPKNIFYWLFGMWGKTGINCFVLITGYFMCKSEITIVKFLKLFIEVEFYGIVIFLVFFFAGYGNQTYVDFIKTLFPIRNVADGFTPCFLLFYLFIPFLNAMIRNISQKQHLSLLILCLFIYVFLGTLPTSNVVMNYVEWFCVLYFIASYIRFYGLPYKSSLAFWGTGLFLSFVIACTSVVFLLFLLNGNGRYFFVADSNKALAVICSICAFMTFKNIKMKRNKTINKLAQSIFGVLIIHTNSDTMRNWLWKDTLDVIGQFYSQYSYFFTFLSVITIFVLCTLIDQLRIIIVERPLFDYIIKHKEKDNVRIIKE